MYRTAEGTFDRIDEYFMHHCNVETEVEEKTAENAEVETSQSNEAKENETKENETKENESKNESLNETKENESNVPSNPSNSLSNPSIPSNPSPISSNSPSNPSNSPSNPSNVPSNSSPYPRLLSYICIDQGKLCTLKYCSNCRIFVPPRAYHCRFCGVYLCFHVSHTAAFGTSTITVPGCRIASGFAITNSFYGFS